MTTPAEYPPPFTLKDIQAMLGDLHRRTLLGCGNHGCIIRAPVGQATNAGCKCYPDRIARELRRLAKHVEDMGSDWGVPTP
jgi:hypothetical protein